MGILKAKLSDYRTRVYTKYFAPVFFVHINKTGGSSIETALNLPFQHRTAGEIRALVGEPRWRQRFSFGFVRNPWDKVASHYHYRVKTNQTGLNERPIPFVEWVRLTYAEQAPPYYDNPKMFMPQVDWLTDDDGEFLVNYVGRFETLHKDFAHVCREIGLQVSLPHLKASARGSYHQYYDEPTVEIVAKWFAKDLTAFGYRFE